MATDYAVIRRLSQDQCCRFIAMGHTIVGDMDGVDFLPNDLAQCQRLLLAAFQQARQLERRTAESEQQAAELNRVLGETAASYEALQQEHAATLDELAWYKRWAYGRRRERFVEDQGQGHLFELELATNPIFRKLRVPTRHRRARPSRRRSEIDWDKLPQIRHEHDLCEEKIALLRRQMDRIGEDHAGTGIAAGEAGSPHHVRPKYACRCCKEGVLCGSASAAADSWRHRRAG